MQKPRKAPEGLRCAIFDFDGTLFDSMYVWDVAGQQYLRSQGQEPKPGIPAFLQALREAGVALCIATATDRYQIEAALTRCGLSEFFPAIFTCSEVGRGKDDPLIYRQAMAHCGADRSHTVIFEDAIHAVETAKADGFTVVGIQDDSEERQTLLQSLSDCYLHDFTDPEAFWAFLTEEAKP